MSWFRDLLAFSDIRESWVAVAANVSGQVCGSNPQRKLLYLSGNVTGSTSYSTRADQGYDAGNRPQGLFCANPLRLSYVVDGPLAQMAWYALASTDQTITVIEVTQDTDPLPPPPKSTYPPGAAPLGTY